MTTTLTSEQAAERLDDPALDQLFRSARTHMVWQPREVPDSVLREIYDVARWGPTSANSTPARFLFIKSPEAKARLQPALAPLNVEKTMSAPVTVVMAYDLEFYEHLPRLFPQADAKAWFAGNAELARETAFRNGTLQGAYFMLAARALGLDCGPMSGFDAEKVNAEFFAGSTWRANFLCNLGYGVSEKLFPRNPRLEFEEASKVL